MMNFRSRAIQNFGLLCGLLIAAPRMAVAHPGHGGHGYGFGGGMIHPFLGFDHLLAAIAVGLWAVLLGQRAAPFVVGSFLLGGMCGWGLVFLNIVLPATGLMTAASIFVLGLMLASAARPPVIAAGAIVGVLGAFFGGCHALSMPLMASAGAYGGGLLVGSALLVAVGAGLGFSIRALPFTMVDRVAGIILTALAAQLLFFA